LLQALQSPLSGGIIVQNTFQNQNKLIKRLSVAIQDKVADQISVEYLHLMWK
jgi:hypothetical protein